MCFSCNWRAKFLENVFCNTNLLQFLHVELICWYSIYLQDIFCRALAPAEWLDREQGIFKINNRQEFATSWYTFKVSKYFCSHSRWANIEKLFCGRGLINACKAKKIESTFDVQGLDHVSWESLYSSVITSFRERNILKQLSSDELVFQVFCIKQLLK